MYQKIGPVPINKYKAYNYAFQPDYDISIWLAMGVRVVWVRAQLMYMHVLNAITLQVVCKLLPRHEGIL